MPYKDPEKRREAGRRRTALYRERHHEEVLQRERELRAANPEPSRARCRAWFAAHPEWRKAYKEMWRKANPESTIATKRKAFSGLTRGEQEALFNSQGGRCAICGEEIGLVSAHLDHNHLTGKVRGFLCAPCNLMLGVARESRERLIAGYWYLQKDI